MTEGQRNRPQGVTLLAIYRFFVGVVALVLAGIVVLATLPMLFVMTDAVGAVVVFFILGMAGFAIFVYAALSLAVGWGLLEMQPWARWIALVLAVLGLLDFPTGTAVGVITIWYLTQDSLVQQFAGTDDDPAPAKAN
jgi:hypothetical protein